MGTSLLEARLLAPMVMGAPELTVSGSAGARRRTAVGGAFPWMTARTSSSIARASA